MKLLSCHLFGTVMKNLQDENVDVLTVVELYNSLTRFLSELRISFQFHKDLAKEEIGEVSDKETFLKVKSNINKKSYFDRLSVKK